MPAYKDLIPYVTVLAELPQAGGSRVIGLLIGGEEGLKIGAPVVGVFEPPSEKTQGLHAIRWRLADSAAS
jgi:uncharacterized protein